MAMELPVIMIACVVIAGGAGYLLDRWLHTSPLLTLLLGFLGFGAGVWDIIRRLSRAEKADGGDGGR
jgi:F0F1-type ATP synthase assembly protein I